jgi:hypothetical protein
MLRQGDHELEVVVARTLPHDCSTNPAVVELFELVLK